MSEASVEFILDGGSALDDYDVIDGDETDNQPVLDGGTP